MALETQLKNPPNYLVIGEENIILDVNCDKWEFCKSQILQNRKSDSLRITDFNCRTCKHRERPKVRTCKYIKGADCLFQDEVWDNTYCKECSKKETL